MFYHLSPPSGSHLLTLEMNLKLGEDGGELQE